MSTITLLPSLPSFSRFSHSLSPHEHRTNPGDDDVSRWKTTMMMTMMTKTTTTTATATTATTTATIKRRKTKGKGPPGDLKTIFYY